MSVTEVRAGAKSRIERVSTMFGRATVAPMLVRGTILLAAVVAMALAFPPSRLASPVAIVLILASLLPALLPRGPAPSIAITLAVVGWLINTALGEASIPVWHVSALAIALYVVHAGAALAAVLPYDAVVAPGTFRPLVIRAGIVSGLTIVVALFVTAIPTFIGKDHRLVLATLGGFVLMITMAIYLSYLGNRRQ
jgi:hypothetical protein